MPEIKRLSNGLRTILVPFSSTEAATVLVMVRVGSRYETSELSGASHFIEHMAFKGTKRRPTTLHISKELDSVGASYNAFTGKSYTGYYAKVPAEHFALAVDLLHDMIFHSRYAPAEMARERKVITEEIKMYEENPMMHLEDLLEMKLLEGNPLGQSIAGTKKTVGKMSRRDVLAFRDKHYDPSRFVVVAAGKLPAEAERDLEKKFNRVRALSAAKESTFRPFVPCSCDVVKAVVQHKNNHQAQLAFGFLSPGLCDEKNDLLAEVLGVILGGTMSSRLFIAVRERRGLAYYVRAVQGAYDDVGVFTIRAGLDKGRLPEAARVIFQTIRSIKKSGPTAAELKLAKNFLKGKLKLGLEDSSARADFYARQELLLDKLESPEALCQRVDKITTKEVQTIANKILLEERMTMAGIGPFASEKKLLKIIGL